MLISLENAECLIGELKNIIFQNYCDNEMFLAELSEILIKKGHKNLTYIIRELIDL